jgi:MFS family permease
MLILARIVQGAGGGALQPISQAVLLEAFPAEKRGSGMSVYTLGVVVAPILGPTLGGWMTDNLSWRWVFYINVPIGILSAAMCFLFLEDPPYLKDTKPGRIDYIGFSLLTLWIGCLQVMLDKGQDADWFSSTFIRVLATGAALGFIVFSCSSKRVCGLTSTCSGCWCWPAPCSCHWCSCSKKAHNRSRRGRPWRINVLFDFVDVRAPFRPSTARGRWRSSQPGSAGAAPTPQ